MKLLEGTYRADRTPDNPVDTTAVDSKEPPKAPSFLKGEGKKLFEERAKVLYPVGLLTEIDVFPFGIYCNLLAEFLELDRKCNDGRYNESYVRKGKSKKTGEPYIQLTQMNSYRMQLLGELHKYEQKFGLTPSDRDGISLNNPEQNKPDTSEKTW
jgi:P27 family predicted phage terminase small subunit